MGNLQNVFNGISIAKEPYRKDQPAPPSGRFWTEEEKDNYYKVLKLNYSDWRNQVLKSLFEKKLINYGQHMIEKSSLEEKLQNGFKNGLTPDEFISNNPKIQA